MTPAELTKTSRWLCLSLLLGATPALANLDQMPAWMGDQQPTAEGPAPDSTYERLLPLAQAGDPAIQNLLGFMHFHGEGVAKDYDQSHSWFHQAAEEGDLRAQRNLGVLHSGSLPEVPASLFAPKEANLWFSLVEAATVRLSSDPAVNAYDQFLQPPPLDLDDSKETPELGQQIFQSFCGGCHGFNGYAAYPAAPSFARGERLDKNDDELLESILNGRNQMPAWGETLSAKQASLVLAYIRSRFPLSDASPQEPDTDTQSLLAEFQGSDLQLGEYTYAKYCAGCHGFNGVAYYVHSPSFAIRERLDKSDDELAKSIRTGVGAMPGWGNMLPDELVGAVVRYLRTLATVYEAGIDGAIHQAPPLFYRFRPIGATGIEWRGADAMDIPPEDAE